MVDESAPGIVLLAGESEVDGDPLGLATGLDWIDALFEGSIQDFEHTFLRSELGPLVCLAFRNLLDALVRDQLEFQYTWAQPTWALAKQHSIQPSQASRLSKVIELTIERWT